MMKAIITSVLSIILLSGCAKESANAGLMQDYPVTDTVSYLALGDSYTIGESVPQKESLPFQLADNLRKQGILVSDLKIIAQTGWTTGDLKNAIVSENITRKFDFVTVLIGVNNQYRGYSQAMYRTEFIELLNTAINFANGDPTKVFVISIPDWGATPFGGSGKNIDISTQIDQFNLINKEESLKLHVSYADITPISRQVINEPSLAAADGLHPSEKMYALWLEQLVPKIREAF